MSKNFRRLMFDVSWARHSVTSRSMAEMVSNDRELWWRVWKRGWFRGSESVGDGPCGWCWFNCDWRPSKMRCGRLLELSLDFDVVWWNWERPLVVVVVVVMWRPASTVKGGDLALSDELSGLTRSTSSLNSLPADSVRVYDGLVFVEKKTWVKLWYQ